ncbi:MAG: class I SAM-dependent methyltransferase, partial [candidate division Zixibacteria bacterium]|nr:class I SAM-dependent methyltransferase [candidate division Zixibacteria bacterium]
MALHIYGRLSQVYDLGWGGFASKYVGLIEKLLTEQGLTRARILDLACGTGNLAVALACRGHIVHGLDLSPEMIDAARSRAGDLPGVSFEVQDMATFRLAGIFDLVTCTYDSVNYLTDVMQVERLLRRVGESLAEPGWFAFDSNTASLYANRHKGIHRRELGGQVLVQKCSYDQAKKEAITIFEFADGEKEIHRQRPYDLAELEPLLARSGLRVVGAYSWFDERPYRPGSERLICVAEKSSVNGGSD